VTAFNEPRRPCSPDLLHTVQTFDHTQHIDCLLNHYKIKDVQVFCFHTTTEQILQYPSPASPIHTDANKGNSLITLQIIHIPRKHKLGFHQMFTKTPASQCFVVSLSFEFLCSNLTDYQAQRKVLAFSQAILACRAFSSLCPQISPFLPPKPLKID
jgi:hypothetical protein